MDLRTETKEDFACPRVEFGKDGLPIGFPSLKEARHRNRLQKHLAKPGSVEFASEFCAGAPNFGLPTQTVVNSQV